MQASGKEVEEPQESATASGRETEPGNEDSATLSVVISRISPLESYKSIITSAVVDAANAELEISNYKQIAKVARDVIWELLFAHDPASDEDEGKAAELLIEHRKDAAFYDPYAYNDWIVEVRDKLLERGMTRFWREVIVVNELGLCWCKDSDVFDDENDTSPLEFYNFGGSEAQFPRESPYSEAPRAFIDLDLPSATSSTSYALATTPFDAILSTETPLTDYKKLVNERVLVDEYIDENLLQENFEKIASAMRDMIWLKLFSSTDSDEDQAAQLLKVYRIDARFHAPWEYNTWIVKVRDELLKREMLDFWRDVMVKNELGLCWARDCDYFDERDDPAPAEFYKHAGCVPPFDTD